MQTQSVGAMRWGRQLGPLICAVVIILATVAMFALKALTPVVASRASVPSNEPSLSSRQTKKLLVHLTSLEIPSLWDKGSLWDDEVTAYDLSN
jgi:hypothetical protein